MSKYCPEQRREIIRTSREILRRRNDAGASRARENVAGHARRAPSMVYKTRDDARIADEAPVAVAVSVQSDASTWSGWVEQYVERRFALADEAVGEVIGSLTADLRAEFSREIKALKREVRLLRRELGTLRDEVGIEPRLASLKAEVDEARQQARNHELESLQRELGTLRNEVELKLNLKSELAAARAEVEELRQRAPSFEHQLSGLQGQIEKVQKTTSRLRAKHSILEYQQKQLDAEQQKNRQQVSLTAVKVTAIGAQTRTALEALRENGFDLWEMEPPSGSIS